MGTQLVAPASAIRPKGASGASAASDIAPFSVALELGDLRLLCKQL